MSRRKAAATPAPRPRAPRRAAAAANQAKRTSDVGPERYRADTYHEIENGGGVLRVEPGDFVVTLPEGVQVMPPERFREAFPDLSDG